MVLRQRSITSRRLPRRLCKHADIRLRERLLPGPGSDCQQHHPLYPHASSVAPLRWLICMHMCGRPGILARSKNFPELHSCYTHHLQNVNQAVPYQRFPHFSLSRLSMTRSERQRVSLSIFANQEQCPSCIVSLPVSNGDCFSVSYPIEFPACHT